MSTLLVGEYPTPFGTLTVVATEDDGFVRASGFRSLASALETLPPSFRALPLVEGKLPEVTRAVEAWLTGDGSLLGEVKVDQPGGPFFQKAWEALRTVPSGVAVSYQELAEMAGSPKAVRAAGQACARNAVAPFVPCHRVVKSGGELGNYGYGGPSAKAAMLQLEGAST